jgi:hypothetical protein
VLLDEFIGESDEFTASEAVRRDTSHAREAAIAEGARQAREMALRRQSSPARLNWIYKVVHRATKRIMTRLKVSEQLVNQYRPVLLAPHRAQEVLALLRRET